MVMKAKSRAYPLGTLALLVLALCAGCNKGPSGTAEKAVSVPVDMDAAKTIYEQRCTVCHGKTGTGDGIGAKALNPKPRNYTDAKWQASVTDAQLKATILGGGGAVGKSILMPGNPDLKGKDPVVNGLVRIIRGFKK